MSEAAIEAVNWVAETKVVVLAPPFHCTTESVMKLVPVTASVKVGFPTEALLGLRPVIVAAGFPVA
jgi:hypothetical protein